MSKRWKNWSASVDCRPGQIAFPESEAQIATLLKVASEKGLTPRVVGAGHSFTPLVQTDGFIISLDKMQGLISIDHDKPSATVWAGTRLKTLGKILHEEGYGLENQGDIDSQSIAGAISTGTHGTGIEFGSMSTQLLSLTLITAAGDILTCSESENREIFEAAQVSLGCLGVITKVEIRLEKKYKIKYVSAKAKFDEVLSKIEELKSQHRNFEFYYFPFTETIQTKAMDLTGDPPKGNGFGKWLNDIFLENGVFWLLSRISRHIPGTSRATSKIAGFGVSSSSSVSWNHEVFATPRLVRFQEMEYSIDAQHSEEALREIKDTIAKENFRVHFPIECRWVRADDIWLSPANGRDSAYIAVHMYKGMPHEKYFAAMEAILKKYNGRPHWGKMHTLSPQELRRRYENWDNFLAVRAQLDPGGLFLNAYLGEMMGV